MAKVKENSKNEKGFEWNRLGDRTGFDLRIAGAGFGLYEHHSRRVNSNLQQ
jgi:hypothetical protein